jgi:hypothetical protein
VEEETRKVTKKKRSAITELGLNVEELLQVDLDETFQGDRKALPSQVRSILPRRTGARSRGRIVRASGSSRAPRAPFVSIFHAVQELIETSSDG